MARRWGPVFFEEFGLPTIPAAGIESPMAVDESRTADYIGSVLDGLWANGAIGAAVWCFSDYAASLFGSAPFDRSVHERSFGLWRAARVGQAGRGGGSCAVGTAATTLERTRVDRHRAREFAMGRRAQLARLYARYCDHVGDRLSADAARGVGPTPSSSRAPRRRRLRPEATRDCPCRSV